MTSRIPALGPRGEGWVAGQLVLLAAIALAGFGELAGGGAGWGPLAAASGIAAIVIGGLLAGRGVWDLRGSLTPFPRPLAGARLVESGAYRLIRHPIYSGLVLGAVGWGLVTGSGIVIVLAALLFALFAFKSSREEAWLVEVYPGYRRYQARTKRLIPWVY